MPRVFVSHSSADREFVRDELVPLLDSHGIATWFCTRDIRSASDWEVHVRAALSTCDWFLVVLSFFSVDSEWVRAEVHWATQNRKGRLVPLLLSDCNPGDMHLQLPTLQYVDCRHGLGEATDDLLAVWGMEARDPLVDQDARTVFESLKESPSASGVGSLKRRAARLSGEREILGASAIVMGNPDNCAFIFASAHLHPVYYIYKIDRHGEDLAQFRGSAFPPPSKGDHLLQSWSTRFDEAAQSLTLLVQTVCHSKVHGLRFVQARFEDCDAAGHHRVRRNFFASSLGSIEVGTRKECAGGDGYGYIFFSESGDVVEFRVDGRTGEVAVVRLAKALPF